jgi:hypothetical protein
MFFVIYTILFEVLSNMINCDKNRKTRFSQFHVLLITLQLGMVLLQTELFCVAKTVHSIPLTCIIQYCRHAV